MLATFLPAGAEGKNPITKATVQCPRGYVGPGGLLSAPDGYQPGDLWHCTGGTAGVIDQYLWGYNHMWTNPTPQDMWWTKPFDPEGTLGYITCMFLGYLGVQAGRILHRHHRPRDPFSGEATRGPLAVWRSGVVRRFVVWGLVTGLIGGGLCGFSSDSGPVPLNNNLWSVSLMFAMAGASFLIMAFLYSVVDILKWWDGTPFNFVGKNPIAIYL
eukprot:gene8914-8068_t